MDYREAPCPAYPLEGSQYLPFVRVGPAQHLFELGLAHVVLEGGDPPPHALVDFVYVALVHHNSYEPDISVGPFSDGLAQTRNMPGDAPLLSHEVKNTGYPAADGASCLRFHV